MAIRAIETEYNGYRFRSRLEARWAVFFDALGVEYEYEPEGYEYWQGEDGTGGYRWLPDFRLPKEGGVLVEVKGDDESLKKDWDKLSMAVDYHNTPASDSGLLILGDIPNPCDVTFGTVPTFSYLKWDKGVTCDFAAFFDTAIYHSKKHLETGIENIFKRAYGYDLLKFEVNFSAGESPMPKCVSTDSKLLAINDIHSYQFNRLKEAYRKARQARFEFGETPEAVNVER